jgi:hypothetical protein
VGADRAEVGEDENKGQRGEDPALFGEYRYEVAAARIGACRGTSADDDDSEQLCNKVRDRERREGSGNSLAAVLGPTREIRGHRAGIGEGGDD